MENKQTLFDRLTRTDLLDNTLIQEGIKGSKPIRILIIALSIILTSAFFAFHLNKGIFENPDYSYAVGYIWNNKTLTAEFSFPIYKDEYDYEQEVAAAKENAPLVFAIDSYSEQLAKDKLNTLIKNHISAMNASDTLQSIFTNETQKNDFIGLMHSFINQIYADGFINLELSDLKSKQVAGFSPPNYKILLNSNLLRDSVAFKKEALNFVETNFISKESKEFAFKSLIQIGLPNLIFSEDYTTKFQQLYQNEVTKTIGFVRKDEIIVSKGEKLNNIHVQKIRSYRSSKSLKAEEQRPIISYLGSLGHTIIIFSLILIFLYKIRKRIFYDNAQLLFLLAILVATGFMAWLSIEIQSDFPVEMLIIIPSFTMLVAIVFDSRTAFYMTATMALLVAGVRGNDYVTAIEMLFAGTLAAYTVRDLQSRTALFQSVFFIFIGYALPITFFALERSFELVLVIQKLSFALINSVVSPILAFGSIYLLEKYTSLTTDLKLQEFNNLNHELMQKLSELAPGTYQHTMGVAMLSERCAIVLNANSLYCKVGAYYHDIGKMKRPEMFIENQEGIGNKHEKLSPRKSAELIIEHVTEGVALAKKYNLPQRLIDMINMHHGTSLVQHFYAKALENAKDGEEINEDDFRYPGPRPNSKEAAIVMICDTAEAISRIGNKSMEQLDSILQNFIHERIIDGQFDDCDISIHELIIVRKTIIKTLSGMSHKRIDYKKIPDKH